MNPILRWAGSKRYLANELVPRFPKNFSRYVEPFCGSSSLYFIIEPQAALLCAINAELINTFNMIRIQAKAVHVRYISIADDRQLYYLVRSIPPAELTRVERAARFLYLNRLCFNGLYRTNLLGKFNVPYGGKRNSAPLEESNLIDASKILKCAEIRVQDFEETLNLTTNTDFIYIDPPYATSKSPQFTEYDAKSFSVPDISRLFFSLCRADARGVKFMLSYSDCQEMEVFTKKWKAERITVRRNIAGFAGYRKIAGEVVITNY